MNRLDRPDEERDGANRRRHVPHHVRQGSRRNDSSGPGGCSGSPDHRPAAVSEYEVLLAFLQRRPDVPGGHPHQMERQRYRSGHAPEVGRAPRRGHGDLRFVQLDVIILEHSARAQLLHEKDLVRRLAQGTVSAKVEQHPSETGRPSLQRNTSTTRRACRRHR